VGPNAGLETDVAQNRNWCLRLTRTEKGPTRSGHRNPNLPKGAKSQNLLCPDRDQPFPPPVVLRATTIKMSAQALNKIAPNSPSRPNPSELEQNIAQALYDLETNTADLKVALRPLQFVSAREVRIAT
jgi:hypothetical protein